MGILAKNLSAKGYHEPQIVLCADREILRDIDAKDLSVIGMHILNCFHLYRGL